MPYLGPIIPGTDQETWTKAINDTEFCSHARTDIPRLLDIITMLQNELDSYKVKEENK